MFDSTLSESLTDMQVFDLRGDSGFMSRQVRLREQAGEVGSIQRLAPRVCATCGTCFYKVFSDFAAIAMRHEQQQERSIKLQGCRRRRDVK